eukprot:SAG31_NODE_23495_length_503_cov_0.888614_2_plen_41_part_01
MAAKLPYALSAEQQAAFAQRGYVGPFELCSMAEMAALQPHL